MLNLTNKEEAIKEMSYFLTIAENFGKINFKKVKEEVIIEEVFDLMIDDEIIELYNNFLEENKDNKYYLNDEDFFNSFFYNNPMKAVKAVKYGNYKVYEEYVKIGDDGNVYSISQSNLADEIKYSRTSKDFIHWLIDNPSSHWGLEEVMNFLEENQKAIEEEIFKRVKEGY